MPRKTSPMRSSLMPRYFFHLQDDIDVPDFEGAELLHLGEAKAYATRQIRALIGDNVRMNGCITLHHRIDVEDADHEVVATVRFQDALNIRA